jgi:hypothetical protein
MLPARATDRPDARRLALVLPAAALALAAAACGSVHAASATPSGPANAAAAAAPDGAEARYKRERERCLSGQSQEDTKTCLREAGAALQAAREHDLRNPDAEQLAANARRRCEVFKTDDDRRACLARVSGEGSVAGSVAGGGILREYTEVIPAPESLPPTAAGRASPAVPPTQPTQSAQPTLPTPPSPAVLPPANPAAATHPASPTPPAR